MFSVCVVSAFLCVSVQVRGLVTSRSPVQGVLQTVLDLITEVKREVSWRRPRPELGCRAKGEKNCAAGKMYIIGETLNTIYGSA
jgi:hypothetical protein